MRVRVTGVLDFIRKPKGSKFYPYCQLREGSNYAIHVKQDSTKASPNAIVYAEAAVRVILLYERPLQGTARGPPNRDL